MPAATSGAEFAGRRFRVSVIGTGYLGAVHAACLAARGHSVIGVDADPGRVAALARGAAPFHEPELDQLLRSGLAAGRLTFSSEIAQAVAAEVHFLCVGTPQSQTGTAADLSQVESAVDALAPYLTEPCLVVGKSTVPVGTAAELAERLARTAPAGRAVEVAWNPEFLREGHAVEDTFRPDRLVFGVRSDAAYLTLRELYGLVVPRHTPVVRTDLATAELAKVSANVMLAARLSTLNTLAEVCEAAQADVGDLITILGLDGRIGSSFLRPGLGFGGSCLPKDLRAFTARADELGVRDSLRLLREVDAVNLRQRRRVVDLALAALGDRPAPPPATVAVLGTAFKAGSDDIRDSPALEVASALHDGGTVVRYFDPRAGASTERARPELVRCPSVEDACRGADVVLVLTDWPEFAGIDPVALGDVVASRTVIDARLVLDPDKWRAAGWSVAALGRGDAAR